MVIDGNSIINRAYYGIRPLTNREGLYTHAVFGFLTTLLRLLKEEEQPDALCVTFDLHAPTFRHKADEAYKATRKPMPEELRMQVPVLKEVLDALNIPRYEMEGWEADDLIGTISRKCEAAGWDCVSGHRRQGQPPAYHRPHQGEAGVHPYGPDHHQGHDPGDLPGAVRL